ncbi:MAG TPA: hypothetical protein VK420_21200, partial [Longimicrobium sp.]|nr:hypothetical protein [Longimicrobium sp.]
TDEAPNDGVVVSASVPQTECQVLEGTLLAMQDSPMGLGLLKSAFSVERFEKAPPRGYRVLYRVALAGV